MTISNLSPKFRDRMQVSLDWGIFALGVLSLTSAIGGTFVGNADLAEVAAPAPVTLTDQTVAG